LVRLRRSEIGDGKAQVTREVDGGLQTIEIELPAVVTTRPRPALATPASRSGRGLINMPCNDRSDILTLRKVGQFNFVATILVYQALSSSELGAAGSDPFKA